MDKEKLLDKMERDHGFYKHNNFKLVDYKDNEFVELKAELNDNSMNPYGFAHGGLIFGLGDNAMGMLAATTGRPAVTLNANITYLRPISGKYMIARATMIKNGKSTAYLKAEIYNDENKLSAVMDSNYFYVE